MNTNPMIADQVETVLRELVERGSIKAGHIIVVGTSTSEVIGQRIGTAGAKEVAEQIYEGVERVRQGIRLLCGISVLRALESCTGCGSQRIAKRISARRGCCHPCP